MELRHRGPVFLASTSRYRRALLTRLGFAFECVDPAVDEAPFQAAASSPDALVRRLAREKALAVAARVGSGLVIGSDQCAALGSTMLGKPGTDAKALAQLQMLRGTTHELWTAVAIVDASSGRIEEALDRTRLAMRPLTDTQLAEYVRRDMPLDCAGSYKIEQAGTALFSRVQCDDPTAIEGLPLTAVVGLLDRFGFDVLAPGL